MIDQVNLVWQFDSDWRFDKLFGSHLQSQSVQVAEMSVTVNNSPIRDYIHPDDHIPLTYEMSPGFNTFIMLLNWKRHEKVGARYGIRPIGHEFYQGFRFTLIVFSPYCAILISCEWLKISRCSLQPISKIKPKPISTCAHVLPLFPCVFHGFWLADWIVCACALWLAIVITSVLLFSFELKASGDNMNESCSRSPLYFDSNYIPVKPIYLELSKVLAEGTRRGQQKTNSDLNAREL